MAYPDSMAWIDFEWVYLNKKIEAYIGPKSWKISRASLINYI
jgi:hypothetical protein